MRAIPGAIAAALEAGVTHCAHVWRFTRRDGPAYAFTDHDRPLAFDALTCEPMAGLAAGVMEKAQGLNVDSASIAGALSSEAISEADIAAGQWDGARVDVYRVDWRDPAQRIHLFAGRIGEVRRGAQAFEAELRGLTAALNAPIGRVFSRHCDADLGDGRCGKDIETSIFRGAGEIVALVSSGALRASGLAAFANGWFARGRIVWASGAASEIAAHRLEAGGLVLIELIDAPTLEVGATFTIYAGCDKRFETCRAKFANTLNFRGFPHMPGNDAVQAGPGAAGAPLDGSSRFR